MDGDDTGRDRRAELAARVARTRVEIADACRAAGRDPDEVRPIAVTKHFPASDVRLLAEVGVTDIGENRDQEASAKAAEVAASGTTVRWHFIGRLQRNKCRSVATYADMVHSVDRISLVAALDKARAPLERELPVLIQVSVDGDDSRAGVVAAEVEPLAEAILASRFLRLRGVMTVAPLDWEPAAAFEALAAQSEVVVKAAPDATEISAGMSADFVEAIGHGATFIRLGAKLLGPRGDVGYPVR